MTIKDKCRGPEFTPTRDSKLCTVQFTLRAA